MRSPTRMVAAPTVVEAAMILLGERSGGSDLELDALLRELDVEVVAFSEDHAHRAREAARSYAGRRGRAGLTMGDCFAYALAIASGEPLLAADDRFAMTDVELVSW